MGWCAGRCRDDTMSAMKLDKSKLNCLSDDDLVLSKDMRRGHVDPLTLTLALISLTVVT